MRAGPPGNGGFENRGRGAACWGAVVDEQGGRRVQIETAAVRRKIAGSGLISPSSPTPGRVEAAQHLKPGARRGEGFAAEVGQAVNWQAAVLEMVEDFPDSAMAPGIIS